MASTPRPHKFSNYLIIFDVDSLPLSEGNT